MTQFIIFLIIGVAGIVVGYYLAVRKKVRETVDRRSLDKDENLRE